MYVEIDPTHETTDDDIYKEEAIVTTNAGDHMHYIKSSDSNKTVPGCVILNQASCWLNQFGKKILGSLEINIFKN